MADVSTRKSTHTRKSSAVSLMDVAAAANVSPGTVSQVLNRNASARIALATQERVWDVANKLGYRPNQFARRLHGKSSNMLGLMISAMHNPYFISIAREFELALPTFGYKMVLDGTVGSPWGYRDHTVLETWPVDGVFVYAGKVFDLREYLGAQADHIPVVFLGCQDDAPGVIVTTDRYLGGKQITEYILSRGYRKLAYVTMRPNDKSDARINALLDTCQAAGVTPECIDFTNQAGAKAAFEMGGAIAVRPREELPEVVFCYDDVTAIGVYHAFVRAGLRVPEDIAVVGYDGIEEGQYLDKALTTVTYPIDVLAKTAIEMMVARLSGESEEESRRVVIPTTVVVGETTR